MWPLHAISEAIVGIDIHSSYIRCSWIQETTSQYNLKACTQQPLLHYEVIDLVLYNSSHIKQCIIKFLHQHQLRNAYAVLACDTIQHSLPREILMQYQLVALCVPLNCIMITSCATAKKATENLLPLSPSFNTLKKHEALEVIGLHILGKSLL